jgi:uncharacterized protein YceK
MKQNRKLFIALCAALAACCGCSSLDAHIPNKAPGVYAGVRKNVGLIVRPGKIDSPYFALDLSDSPVVCCTSVTYGLIGLPFEAAMDTLLLPIDLTYDEYEFRAARSPAKRGR